MNSAGTTGHSHTKKKKNTSRHRLYMLQKMNSKWIRARCKMRNYKTPR